MDKKIKNVQKMIILLDDNHYTLPFNIPLVRAGFLENKNFAISRRFDHLAFCYVLSGSSGWLKSKAGNFKLTPPFALLSLPGEEKSYGPDESWDEFYFVCSKENFESLLEFIPFVQTKNGVMAGELIPDVEKYINIMRELTRKPMNYENKMQLDYLASLILAISFWRPEPKSLSKNDRRVEEILAYINCNYWKNLSLPELAEKFGLSYANFRRLWQKKFQCSPHQMIMKLRNVEAKELLSASTLSIADVASHTGFPDQRYFSRFFHKMNGYTPSEYRKRFLSK